MGLNLCHVDLFVLEVVVELLHTFVLLFALVDLLDYVLVHSVLRQLRPWRHRFHIVVLWVVTEVRVLVHFVFDLLITFTDYVRHVVTLLLGQFRHRFQSCLINSINRFQVKIFRPFGQRSLRLFVVIIKVIRSILAIFILPLQIELVSCSYKFIWKDFLPQLHVVIS